MLPVTHPYDADLFVNRVAKSIAALETQLRLSPSFTLTVAPIRVVES